VDEIPEDRLDSGTDDNPPSDRRALARQHTTRMLKVLRGYGPQEPSRATEPRTADRGAESRTAKVTELASARPPLSARGGMESVTTAESTPRIVADTRAPYMRLVEESPPLPLSLAASAIPPPRPAERSSPPVSIDSLRPPEKEALKKKSGVPSLGESLARQPGVLGQLIARSKELAQSSRIFQAYLPPHLRDHAVLIRMDEEAWTVQTDAASWATRLRYKLYDIRQALGQQLGITLPKPRIRVEPAATSSRSRRPPLTLTQENARLIAQIAQDEPDARLSAALRRLAKHTASDDP